MTDTLSYTASSAVVTHYRMEMFGHTYEPMHHVGDDGRHYCPTGFMVCNEFHDGEYCGQVEHAVTSFVCLAEGAGT